MSVPYYGDFAEDDTVNIPFNTFSSDDPSKSITITELADSDIKVYKDGNTAEIATDGATVVIDFDGHVGAHLITIDTSVDAAYATGSEYVVLIDGTVIDLATDMDMWIGAFSIERAGGALALLKGGTVQVDLITINTIATQLQMLMDASTTINADADLTGVIVDKSVLSHVMTPAADTSTYNASTDSQEAIKVHADTIKAETVLIVQDTGTTLDALIKDIPTTAELALRTLLAADYVVVGDTIAGCTVTGSVSGNVDGLVSGTVAGVTPEAAGVAPTTDEISDKIAADMQADPTDYHVNVLEVEGGDATTALEAAVDAAFDNAIPGAPTADSINQYIQQLKYVLVNQMAITEATGNVEIKKDDDATSAATVAAAFATAAGTTTRKRLE